MRSKRWARRRRVVTRYSRTRRKSEKSANWRRWPALHRDGVSGAGRDCCGRPRARGRTRSAGPRPFSPPCRQESRNLWLRLSCRLAERTGFLFRRIIFTATNCEPRGRNYVFDFLPIFGAELEHATGACDRGIPDGGWMIPDHVAYGRLPQNQDFHQIACGWASGVGTVRRGNGAERAALTEGSHLCPLSDQAVTDDLREAPQAIAGGFLRAPVACREARRESCLLSRHCLC